MDMAQYAGIPLVAVMVGLGQLLKYYGFNSKYVPLANIIMGIVAGIVMFPGDLLKAIITGIAIGLSATGLYSGSKNVTQGMRASRKGKKVVK